MTKKTRQVLNYIDRVLVGKDQQTAKEVWDVLAGAVRGPDDGNSDYKVERTIPLRRHAFPRTARKADKRGNGKIAGGWPVFTGLNQLPKITGSCYNHYLIHTDKAIEVLRYPAV